MKGKICVKIGMEFRKINARFVAGIFVLSICAGLFSGVHLFSSDNMLAQGKLKGHEQEKILFEDLPIVVTAARKKQKIVEAPSTIDVISSDDIRYSGAFTIADLLRQVSGVDVMTISARSQQVGVRGFIDASNNKLLVMVDGRSVYLDSDGSVQWNLLPVSLSEIDHIEVVKSPSSSLYGANAYSGVINIITKLPEQYQGTTLKLTVGELNTYRASIQTGRQLPGT
jgi:iron complex outermembrane receptor protein